MENSISIITLSRNNPEELERTVRSVGRQTHLPDEHIVVDSSSTERREEMERIASTNRASYQWIPPEGIYPAMQKSIDFAKKENYIWWLNSSDRLSGSGAIDHAARAITMATARNRDHWVIGQLIRERKGRYGLHEIGTSGPEFARRYGSGLTGFPHPSTLFKLSSLASLEPYSGGMAIAEDYRLGLNFLSRFGAPWLASEPLSIHAATGFSYQHPVRHFIEKAQIRRTTINGWGPIREVGTSLRNLPRLIGDRLTGRMGAPLRSLSGLESIPGLHFCDRGDVDYWPQCCEAALNA